MNRQMENNLCGERKTNPLGLYNMWSQKPSVILISLHTAFNVRLSLKTFSILGSAKMNYAHAFFIFARAFYYNVRSFFCYAHAFFCYAHAFFSVAHALSRIAHANLKNARAGI